MQPGGRPTLGDLIRWLIRLLFGLLFGHR